MYMFLAAIVVYFEIIQTQNRRPNNLQKTSLKGCKET